MYQLADFMPNIKAALSGSASRTTTCMLSNTLALAMLGARCAPSMVVVTAILGMMQVKARRNDQIMTAPRLENSRDHVERLGAAFLASAVGVPIVISICTLALCMFLKYNNCDRKQQVMTCQDLLSHADDGGLGQGEVRYVPWVRDVGQSVWRMCPFP